MSEHGQTVQAHTLHFAAVAAQELARFTGDGTARGQLEALALSTVEEGNFGGALECALLHGWAEELLPLAGAQAAYHSLRGGLLANVELGKLLRTAGECDRNLRIKLRAALILAASLNRLGRYSEAATEASAALAAARELDDGSAVAEALHLLADATNSLGEVDKARGLYSETIELARKGRLPLTEALALRSSAQISVFEQDLATARAQLTAALKLLQGLGNLHREAMTMSALAIVEMLEGNLKASRSLHRQCLARQRDLGDNFGQAVTLDMLATATALDGGHLEACAYYGAALLLYDHLGLPHYTLALSVMAGACLVQLGIVQPGALALLCHTRVRDAGYKFMEPEQRLVDAGLAKLDAMRQSGTVKAEQIEDWRSEGGALETGTLAAVMATALASIHDGAVMRA